MHSFPVTSGIGSSDFQLMGVSIPSDSTPDKFEQRQAMSSIMPQHPCKSRHANRKLGAFLASIRERIASSKAHGVGNRGTSLNLDCILHVSRRWSSHKPYTALGPLSDSGISLPDDHGATLDVQVQNQPADRVVRNEVTPHQQQHEAGNDAGDDERSIDIAEYFPLDVSNNTHVGLTAGLNAIREKPGVSRVDIKMLALALSEASGRSAVKAQAALSYLCSVDLVKEIKDASEHPLSLPEPWLRESVSDSIKNMAWRTAQLLSTSRLGMDALRAIARKDESYDFHEPVLNVFLRTAKRMSDAKLAGDAVLTPQSLIVFGRYWTNGTLLHDGLCAAAKRLSLGDLQLLSWKEKYAFAMARNGLSEDGPGSPAYMADYRTTKAVDSWVRRAMKRFNFFHKSPMSQITNKSLLFMKHGGVGECRGMYEAIREMRDAMKNCNDLRALSPPQHATADEAATYRAAIIRDYIREAMLEVWNGKTLLETKDGGWFGAHDLAKIEQLLQTRLNARSAALDARQFQSGAANVDLPALAKEFSLHRRAQATPELLQTWWNETKTSAGDHADSVCANEARFNQALARARGEIQQSVPWPKNFKGMDEHEGRQRIAEAIKDAWTGMEVSSSLKAKDAGVFGTTSKNFLSRAISAFKGAGVIQFRPQVSDSRSTQGIFTMGLSGDSASISFLKKKATTRVRGFGMFFGRKLTIANQGIAAGAGFDAAYLHETAHSEGVIYRMDRKGLPAKGGDGGRAAGLMGDAQLVNEMGKVSEILIQGVTEEEKRQGMTPMMKVLSTFPDSLSVTVVTPESDAEDTKIGTIAVNCGVSAALGRFSVGPSAAVVAGVRKTTEARIERGDAFSIERRAEGRIMHASAGFGVGGSAIQKITDTDSQGIGSVNTALTWDIYAAGANIASSLFIVDGEVDGGSNRIVAYPNLDGLATSIRSRLDALAAQRAETSIDEMEKERAKKGEQVSDDERRRVVEEARQHILKKLNYFKNDLTATQSFVEFAELTQDATDRLNELFARGRMAEETNPVLFQELRQAIDAMINDPCSWVVMYALVVDSKEVGSAVGMNIGLFKKKQAGQFTNYLRNFLVFK